MLIEFDTGLPKRQALRGSGFVFEICEWDKRINKKTEEPMGFVPYRWYSSLESALNDIIRLKVCTNKDINTLTELRSAIVRIKEELKGYYEGI